jgi:hypothetical protein
MSLRYMCVDLRGPARTVPQQLLDETQIDAVFQQMGGKGMSQTVKGITPLYIGGF